MATIPVCLCGETTIITTSWTEENPGRRFLSCKRRRSRMNGHCNYFAWADPPMQPRAKVVING
ncbi:hypothetical protein LINPERHAP2_LOCUS36890, partial [Linum perenne]